MFDVQVLRHRGEAVLPENVLASIAAYYRRVTTDAAPMNRLVSVVMAIAVAGSLYQLFSRTVSASSGIVAVGLCCVPIGLALRRIFPAAIRLGARTDAIERQSEMARSICRDHLLCLAAIAAFVSLQLLG